MNVPTSASGAVREPGLAWPGRRRLAFGVLVPVLGGVLVAVAGPAQVEAGAAWWALLSVAAVAGAGTLASYVPASGLRPDVGCTPCAAVSAVTVAAAAMLLRDAGPDLTGAALAAAVSIFGLGQRLGQPRACAKPDGPAA